MSIFRKIIVMLALLAAVFVCGPARAADDLLVFAAASTTDAVGELAKTFQEKTGAKVVCSFASSSTLAKQIEQGAPADVYISANVKWTDYLEKAGGIAEGTRINLLHNRLGLIASADSKLTKLNLTDQAEFVRAIGDGRLAMGDPDHVPAGIYGKQALVSLGLWPSVSGKIAAAANVRTAMALVEIGEAPLGIVYTTDAAVSKKVRLVAVFPAESHDPIVYPAALVAGRDTEKGRAFLKFLTSPEAKAVFERYGFGTN